jgi:hypothetical protein
LSLLTAEQYALLDGFRQRHGEITLERTAVDGRPEYLYLGDGAWVGPLAVSNAEAGALWALAEELAARR